MRKALLWLTAVVAVASSQHAALENTIENNVVQKHDLDQHDDNTEVLNDDEVQSSTNPPEDNNIEEYQHEATTTTESHIITEVVTNDYTTVTGHIETKYETPVVPGQDESLEKSGEIRTSSEEFFNVQPENHDTNATVVETTSGPVRGHQWHDISNIISYIDIPYGIFKGRFQPPEPPERTSTIHESQEHSKRCPQLHNDENVGDTDCLTLSIFAPENVENASVLFHIYDGKFVSGSGDPAIYGPEYLVPQGVILVLPNYRLGPLGFVCLQNDIAPGNAALKDLTLALNWTRENIRYFGGNPYNIVVSGDGMSGALAGYLALSPKSKHYINKVIVESGSVLSYWALDRNPTSTSFDLLEKIEEHGSIEDVDMNILLTSAQDIEFKPCLENSTDSFMVDTPWNMVHSDDINITFMIGTAMYAGIHEALKQSEDSINKINGDYGLLLPNDLKFENDAEKTSIGEKIKTQYFGENAISLSDVKNLTLCFTDAAYLGPGIRSARPLVDAGTTVYFYEFSFVGDFNRELESINRPVDGAVRGDIIGYVFTQDGQVPHDGTEEERMVRTIVDLWTNFMQTGHPSSENIAWNKLDNTSDSEEEWLSIGTEPAMMKGIHVERMKLWTDIYKKHFIEHNLSHELSSSVYAVLTAQFVFWITFFKNISYLY